MKTYFRPSVMVMFAFLLSITACNNDDDVTPQLPDQPGNPIAPTARAGNDTTIYPPFTSSILDGSASTDPDNNIVSFEWEFLGGPATASIENHDRSIAHARGLTEIGNYEFELTVTDANKLSSKDTVVVSVVELHCANTSKGLILKDLSWVNDGWSITLQVDIFSHLPANSYIKKIHIKRDSSDDWESVLYYHDSPGYDTYSWDYINGKIVIYGLQFSDEDTPDVKIEYCN